MIKGLVNFFNGAERSLDFPFGTGGDSFAVFAFGDVGANLNAEIVHHFLEDSTATNRTVIHVEHLGYPLEGKSFCGLGGHGIEEKL